MDKKVVFFLILAVVMGLLAWMNAKTDYKKRLDEFILRHRFIFSFLLVLVIIGTSMFLGDSQTTFYDRLDTMFMLIVLFVFPLLFMLSNKNNFARFIFFLLLDGFTMFFYWLFISKQTVASNLFEFSLSCMLVLIVAIISYFSNKNMFHSIAK